MNLKYNNFNCKCRYNLIQLLGVSAAIKKSKGIMAK